MSGTAHNPLRPFRGRKTERETLARVLLDHRETGRGAFVLIGGEAGMGKTALVHQLLSESGNVQVLRVRCTGDAFPFSPLVRVEKLLHPSLGQVASPGDPVSAGSGRARPRFAAGLIARQIEDVRRGGRRAIDSETLRRRAVSLHQGFLELFDQIPTPVDKPPRVLLLDDLHRTDDDTLRVLERLTEPPYPVRALIIANYRLGPLSPGLERIVQGVQFLSASDARFTHMRLRALEIEDVAAIVEARLPEARFTREAVAELTNRCGGSPAHVARALDRMVAEGWLKPTKRGSLLELPEDLAVARYTGSGLGLEGVAPELRATLRRASVLGARFSSALLARLEEREETAVLESFQSAHDAGNCPVEMVGDAWTFREPDLVADLRDELLPPLRAAYAAKAARILRGAQKRAPDSGLPRIYPGRIAALCEMAEDPVGALSAHIEAAANDETLLALASARYHLQRARDLIALGVSLPGTDANLGWHLAADHGRVLLATTAEPPGAGAAAGGSTTELQRGLVLLNEALAEADAADADVRDRATLRATLAAALLQDPNSRAEALTQVRRARTLLVVGGFPAQSWHHAGREADALIALGDRSGALKTLQAALKYFRKEGADMPLAKADLAATLLRLASLRRGQLAPLGAEEHESQRKALESALDEAADLFRAIGDQEGLARVQIERGRFLFHLSQALTRGSSERRQMLEDARRYAETALSLLEKCCTCGDLADTHQLVAEVQAAGGAIEVAVDRLRRAGLYRLTDGERDLSDIFRALRELGFAAADRVRNELMAAGATERPRD